MMSVYCEIRDSIALRNNKLKYFLYVEYCAVLPFNFCMDQQAYELHLNFSAIDFLFLFLLGSRLPPYFYYSVNRQEKKNNLDGNVALRAYTRTDTNTHE